MPLLHLIDIDDLILAIKERVLNRLVQTGLVALNRQQVIRLPGDDLLGNGALAAHRIDTDEEAFQVQGIEQFGNGRFASVAGTTYCFAVDCDRATQIRDEAAHPPPETGFELLRVEQAENPQKGVFRRNAVLEHQELSQQSGVRPRPRGHVFNRVAVRRHWGLAHRFIYATKPLPFHYSESSIA